MKYTKHNILLVGSPKAAGKSTFGITVHGSDAIKLVLKCDVGQVTIPPGIDPRNVYVRQYPSANPVIDLTNTAWVRSDAVGKQIYSDILAIAHHFQEIVDPPVSNPQMVLGGTVYPRPDVLILDGLVDMSDAIYNWILAMDHKLEPDDYENSYTPWRKRLDKLNVLFSILLPLPLSIVLITWDTPEMKSTRNSKGKTEQVATGRVFPDVGGKMDLWAPGKVDAAIYCFNRREAQRGLRYYARIKGSENLPWCGVRNYYGPAEEVDVTIEGVNSALPFDRVFRMINAGGGQ